MIRNRIVVGVRDAKLSDKMLVTSLATSLATSRQNMAATNITVLRGEKTF